MKSRSHLSNNDKVALYSAEFYYRNK